MNRAFLIVLLLASLLASCQKSMGTKMKGEIKMGNKNIELVKQYFEHFNNHDWNNMSNMYIENAHFKDPTLGKQIVTLSREDINNKYTELNTIFPDIHDEIIKIYPSGNEFVIVEFVSSGTAGDGSSFELPICTIFSFENGQITKDYSYFDNFEE